MGIISFDDKSSHKNINIIRPLIQFSRIDLKYIAKKVFETYIEDPSNKNIEYKRVKIRNFIKNLELEGLDKDKFNLTINNLKFANDSIKYFVKKNLKDNSTIINENKSIILRKNFFYQPEEVVFRSLTKVLRMVGKNYYSARGKKIDRLINQIKIENSFKITLGKCIIKKVNNTIIVSKEH